MKNASILTALVAPVSFVLFASTSYSSSNRPNKVEFRRVTHNGSGCPRGTVAKTISPDRQAFTLAFSEYIAETGPFTSRREKYKNCIVTVDLDFPGGWQWAITKFDYRGFAQLDSGVIGQQTTRYWFQGYNHGKASSRIHGPYNKDYHFTDEIEVETWSPCGATRALNVNSDIRLSSRTDPNAGGFMTLDSLDGSVSWEFEIAWRRC